MPYSNTSRITRLYYFLTYRCHIPLAAAHYYDLLVLGILAGACLLLCAWQGGMTAASLPWASRVVALAIGAHLLTLTTREETGINLQRAPLFFFPWLFWCLLDWLFFSPEPWRAEASLIVNCMVFAVFSLALYHFRVPLLKWIIGGISAVFITIATAVSLGTEERLFAWLFGSGNPPPLSISFGSSAGAGAVLLMVFFPCFVVALGCRWRYWQRLLAVPACVILAAGVFATAHIGVMTGFFVGIVLVSLLAVERVRSRVILILLGALVFFCLLGFSRRDVGVWRNDGGASARGEVTLADAAGWAVADAPIQGLGTGGFAQAFEKRRPEGWISTPRTPGSLPLALLAEHGLLGTVLLAVPVLWIWFSALATCLAAPYHERREKPAFTHKRKRDHVIIAMVLPPMPDTRLFLSGALAGSAAAGIVLVFDYPGQMPAVACVFALLGAAMLRHTRTKPFPLVITPLRAVGLRAMIVLQPAVWLLWTLAPLEAARHSATAARALAPLLPSVNSTGSPVLDLGDVKRLEFVAEKSFAALRANPGNGDAWRLHALAALCFHGIYPDQGARFTATALHASERAVELAPDNFEFQLTRAAALQMASRHAEAVQAFEFARSLAPWSAAVALAYADALGASGTPGELNWARGLLNQAKSRHPENPRIHARLPLFQLGATAAGGESAPPAP